MEKISRKGFLKIAAAAAMSSVTAAGLAACNAASSSTAAASSGAAGIYTPGTYTATAKGMSEITATVTFDAASITKVELDLSGETDSIGQAAKDKLIEQVMNAQTSQIDGVTGATVTSKAVQNAVADCIRQASGGAINPAEQTTEETASTADWLGEAWKTPKLPRKSATRQNLLPPDSTLFLTGGFPRSLMKNKEPLLRDNPSCFITETASQAAASLSKRQ